MIEKIPGWHLSHNKPTFYDADAGTMLELASTLHGKMNETIDSFNNLEQETNEHLENQDSAINKMNDETMPAKVTEEVQRKIESGEFDQAISHYAGELDVRVNNLLGSVSDGSTILDAEVIDLRVDPDGKTHENAGLSIRNTFKTLPVAKTEISTPADLNDYKVAGNYVIATTEPFTNVPASFYTKGLTIRYLVVETFGKLYQTGNTAGWGRQTIYSADGAVAYRRYFSIKSSGTTFTGWRRLQQYTAENNDIITGSPDMNKIVEHGVYCVADTTHTNAPSALNGIATMLEVTNYNTQWIGQVAYPISSMGNDMYFRVGRNRTQSEPNFSENLNVTWQEWRKVATDKDVSNILKQVDNRINSLSDKQSNHGYIIVNMGDSITGNYNDETSISANLSNLTGATVYNCGFGGCQMTPHSMDEWTPFSMCSLADAIASGDFSTQTAMATANVDGMPAYFIDHVNTLKSIDFSKVDIITIAYGTNDFRSGDLIEKDGHEYDRYYYTGALRHSIETICNAYPNIRIVVCTPLYRIWFENGEIQYESDTYKINNLMLPDYAKAVKEVCAEYHIPVCDYYNEMSVNKHNWNVLFTNTDGTHPHADGRHLMAKKLAKIISAM